MVAEPPIQAMSRLVATVMICVLVFNPGNVGVAQPTQENTDTLTTPDESMIGQPEIGSHRIRNQVVERTVEQRIETDYDIAHEGIYDYFCDVMYIQPGTVNGIVFDPEGDIIPMEQGAHQLARLKTMYYMLPDLINEGPNLDLAAAMYFVYVQEELTLEPAAGLLVMDESTGDQRRVCLEANLYFLLCSYALIEFMPMFDGMLDIPESVDMFVARAEGHAHTILTTIASQLDSPMHNAPLGLFTPFWIYNGTDFQYYPDWQMTESKTDFELTALYYQALLADEQITAVSHTLELAEGLDVHLAEKLVVDRYTGAYGLKSAYEFDASGPSYTDKQIGSLAATSSVLGMLGGLITMYEDTNLAVAVNVTRIAIDLIRGMEQNFTNYETGMLVSKRGVPTGMEYEQQYFTSENAVFYANALLTLATGREMRLRHNNITSMQVFELNGLSGMIQESLRKFMGSTQKTEPPVFHSGFDGENELPWLDEHVKLHAGVVNGMMLGLVQLLRQASFLIVVNTNVHIAEEITAVFGIDRFAVFRRVPYLTEMLSIGELTYTLTIAGLDAEYSNTVSTSSDGLYTNVTEGTVFRSENFTAAIAHENGQFNLVFDLKDNLGTEIANDQWPLLVLGSLSLDGDVVTSDGSSVITNGVSEFLTYDFLVLDSNARHPVSGVEYNVTIVPYDEQPAQLPGSGVRAQLVEQTSGVTSSDGKISSEANINVTQWEHSWIMFIDLHHDQYEPAGKDVPLFYVHNELELRFQDPSALTVTEGAKSTRIQYYLQDSLGNSPRQAKVEVMLTGEHANGDPFSASLQSDLTPSGDFVFKESTDGSKKLQDLRPDTYELLFSVSNTLFGDGQDGVVELNTSLVVEARGSFENVRYQLEQISEEYGWVISAGGGLVAIIGLFRGRIFVALGRARRCHFCGDHTSTKFPVCRNCGRTLDDTTADAVASDAATATQVGSAAADTSYYPSSEIKPPKPPKLD